MFTVERSRTIAARPERVWQIVVKPERLVEWWPDVRRVEDVSSRAWTTVLEPPGGGRSLRADYTLVSADHPRLISWRHEVDESPFERIFSEAVTELEMAPSGDGTVVTLRERLTLRGFSRLGRLQVRRARKRGLDRALDGLAEALAPGGTA